MYIPFTDYINQTHINHTVANRPNRSNDQRFMLKTKTTTAPTLLIPCLAPTNIADTHSFSCTNNTPFQTKTNLKATANQCQTLYEPYTAIM